MTKNEIMDLVGITFVIEALILSEKMRDFRLTDLEEPQVENLAIELYLSMEKMRSKGEGYMEMGDSVNQIIESHLSSLPTDPEADRVITFNDDEKDISRYKTDTWNKAVGKSVMLFNSLTTVEQEVLGEMVVSASYDRDTEIERKKLMALAELNVESAISRGEAVSTLSIDDRIDNRFDLNKDDDYIRDLGEAQSYSLSGEFVEHEIYYEKKRRAELGLQAENADYLELVAHDFGELLIGKYFDKWISDLVKLNRGRENEFDGGFTLDKNADVVVSKKRDGTLVFECKNPKDESNPHRVCLTDRYGNYDRVSSTIIRNWISELG